MSGERDLAVLLRTMQPVLDPVEYGFATLPWGTPQPGLGAIATFVETEGTSLIAPAEALAAAGLAHRPGWARITLTVHSALEAVGLTAAVAAALAHRGISANMVAAFHHDHVFVPWDRRAEAMAALAAFARA
ncbi:MAG: ACT domain-containing protein [Thermohalobaculum sp.]|nr:ACT domain-containing protein [Thermohalobaculum sp.]